jgi:carboxyl-terminal processing protease
MKFLLPALLVFNFSFAQNEMSKRASDFLQKFIDVAKKNPINKDSVEWKSLQSKVFEIAKNAQTPEDTYEAIRLGIKMINNGHSFLMTAKESIEWKNDEKNDTIVKMPVPTPYGKITNSVGYINLPWFDSGNKKSCILFADTLQSVVKNLDAANGLKGWIIDLRDNLGGNNWPMLVRIGSLYETNKVGEFVYPNGKKTDWVCQVQKFKV